ncbi:major facilitator superfamily transporter [Xylariales sp. PMI_506]|nr:major facilitator superfamily transporter [Xylariales sp. PMI_506]
MSDKLVEQGTEPSECLPPGTVRLIDTSGDVLSKHAEGKGQSDIILVPAPSEDPEDPLNWSFRRKILATSCVVMYTIMIAIPSSAVYSIVTPIRAETSLTLTDINNGTGIMFLFYGWGCVVWQAIALQYGKRPVFLFSILANVIILATGPLCTTSGTYIANRIILGFFGAPVESLTEVSIADVWFAHERPKYLAWYGWSLALTGKLAPMISGFINVGMGWKWTLWWCAIFNAIAFVYCFFLMEETNYDRSYSAQTPQASPIVSEAPSHPQGTIAEKSATSIPEDRETGEVIWPRKTFLDKLAVKDKKRSNRLIDILIAPFKGFTYPAVVYAGLMYGANSLVWTGVQNATIGTVYTTQYGFSTAGVGAAYAAGVLGTIIGGYYSGKVGLMLTIRLARRNGGISEPEHGLYLFAASMFLVPFAMILLAINGALCVSAALNYAMSSYAELAGQMVTTCVLIRNTLSFAINYGITPWLNASGYLRVYCIVAGIGLAWNASILVMTRYGRSLRETTADRYYRDVNRARAKGLGH